MGKKKGHLYIQIGYDEKAESSGFVGLVTAIIENAFPGKEPTETKRKGDQVYSQWHLRIW